jgi:hypothetical protein
VAESRSDRKPLLLTDRRRGVALLSALLFVALLSVLVMLQMERLPFDCRQSRAAPGIAQRGLDANSALVLATSVLETDAGLGAYDAFADSWARPHSVRVGTAEIEVRIADWAFARVPQDRWLLHDYGFSPETTLLATEDEAVLDLFQRVRPNLNTAPLPQLQRGYGLGTDAISWLRDRRQSRPLTSLDDLKEMPGYRDADLALGSSLFFAKATIRRADGAEERRYWVLRREGTRVFAIHAGQETESP